jgi:hypothetical protein
MFLSGIDFLESNPRKVNMPRTSTFRIREILKSPLFLVCAAIVVALAIGRRVGLSSRLIHNEAEIQKEELPKNVPAPTPSVEPPKPDLAKEHSIKKNGTGRAKLTPAETQREAKMQASIGVATMNADRTIVLDLRAEASDGTIGDSRLVYPPTHKDYDQILKHLGGLRPGERKPVPPWADGP